MIGEPVSTFSRQPYGLKIIETILKLSNNNQFGFEYLVGCVSLNLKAYKLGQVV